MKKILLLSVMALSTSAMAAEVTNPFYVPNKNTVASTTSVDANRVQIKNDAVNVALYDKAIRENLQYGLADNWSLDASISNTWAKGKEVGFATGDTDEKNVDFEVGTTYNITKDEPLQIQSRIAYGQKDTRETSSGAYKYVAMGAKVGYQSGIYTPYVQGNVEVPVFQPKDGANEMAYMAKAGLYAYCPKMKTSVDTGVRVNYNENVESRVFIYDLEASYLINDKMAVSLYGSYMLDGQMKYDTSLYSKTIGAKFRVQF